MAKILDKQRYKCAMSAMQTVQAIERAIPVLHSGPGCAQKLSNSSGSSGYFSPNIYPCTALTKGMLYSEVLKSLSQPSSIPWMSLMPIYMWY